MINTQVSPLMDEGTDVLNLAAKYGNAEANDNT